MNQNFLRYKCNISDLFWQGTNAFVCLFLFLLIPKSFFKKQLSKKLFNNNLLPRGQEIIYYKSGRAAISGTLTTLKNIKPNYRKILLPDYICDVVYKASENAGFLIESYKTNDSFSPLWNELLFLIQGNSNVVVLLASMFGRVNTDQKHIDEIFNSNPNTFIIADECQHLVSRPFIKYRPNMAIIFSFNKKTIPGLMGGGVCISNSFSMHIKPNKLKIIKGTELNGRLFLHLIKEILLYFRLFLGKPIPFNIDSPKYEYSEFKNILYDCTPHEIAKISLIKGWVLFRQINKIEQLRLNNYKIILRKMKTVLMRPNMLDQNRSVFIPLKKNSLKINWSQFVFIKKPYALINEHESTEKEIYCLKNSISLPMTDG